MILVIAIKRIEAIYGLGRINWEGDPCIPQKFLWDGLTCKYTNMSTPPRIISLYVRSLLQVLTFFFLNYHASKYFETLHVFLIFITRDLSFSGLTGAILPEIQNLTQLQILYVYKSIVYAYEDKKNYKLISISTNDRDLSNNNLTGEVPEFLGNMKSLLVV